MSDPSPKPTAPAREILDVVAAALAAFAANMPKPIEPEGMNAEATATYLGVAVSTVHDLNDRGLMPAPVTLGDGRCRRFRRSELLGWLAAGCPSRAKWEQQKLAAARRGGAA